ncbi:hypothetical protein HK100_010432 [Physocladia obscura]|uniref:Uncharacterized protein n=1 Tax=Physocladia obscura TaxID=109957 RepID=A0AAD5XHJ5_9FUNG|nr:hypothetical protein HK100_010432 [Physocladia obscura]
MEFLETCATGNVDAVKVFLDADWAGKAAVVQFAHPINKWTGLMWAVKRNHIAIAELLVQNGANVNAVNAKGTSIADLCSSDEMRSVLGLAPTPMSVSKNPKSDVFVPNYLIDAASLPSIDQIMAETKNVGSSSTAQIQSNAPAYHLNSYDLNNSVEIQAEVPTQILEKSKRKEEEVLQEIIVYIQNKKGLRCIVGAIYFSGNMSILQMVQQVYYELDIDEKLVRSISRLSISTISK